MKTIKTLFIAALVVGSVACKNESAVIESTSCNDLVAIAQADLDVANARLGELTSSRSEVTSERNEILDAGRSGLSTVVSETMLSDLDDQIIGMNQSISAQGEVVVEAREALANAIANCPSSDRSVLETLDLEGSDLEDEIGKVEVAEETAREMIDRLNPMIMDAYEEIQALEDEKSDAEAARAETLELNISVDEIAELVSAIDADLASIEEELLKARRRYSQYSDARRMAYLTVDTTVSVGEDLENIGQQPL